MENKINIAELLKDCPQGMELDCAMYDKVILVGVDNILTFPIKLRRKDGCLFTLTKYGQYCNNDYAKCVIFPKGKTTWEGFVPPCQFKNGDILTTNDGKFIAIIKKNGDKYYCCYHTNDTYFEIDGSGWFNRFATEEEKAKLFKAIKDNGYRWDAKTKTLEKLPKFKVGDRVKHISSNTSGIVVKVCDKCYHIDYPKGEGICYISFALEKDYELAPNKFDITTLKPFDKILVRDENSQKWRVSLYSHYNENDKYPFYTVGIPFHQCIPYESNEHLLGTTNDCDDFYKTWEI